MYLGLPGLTIHEQGKSNQVQTTRWEVVVDPSETIRWASQRDDDIVRSAWRHAEVSRNEEPRRKVSNKQVEIGSGYGLTFNGVLLDGSFDTAIDKGAGVELSFATNGSFSTTLS